MSAQVVAVEALRISSVREDEHARVVGSVTEVRVQKRDAASPRKAVVVRWDTTAAHVRDPLFAGPLLCARCP